jgi:hypothetical protein
LRFNQPGASRPGHLRRMSRPSFPGSRRRESLGVRALGAGLMSQEAKVRAAASRVTSDLDLAPLEQVAKQSPRACAHRLPGTESRAGLVSAAWDESPGTGTWGFLDLLTTAWAARRVAKSGPHFFSICGVPKQPRLQDVLLTCSSVLRTPPAPTKNGGQRNLRVGVVELWPSQKKVMMSLSWAALHCSTPHPSPASAGWGRNHPRLQSERLRFNAFFSRSGLGLYGGGMVDVPGSKIPVASEVWPRETPAASFAWLEDFRHSPGASWDLEVEVS